MSATADPTPLPPIVREPVPVPPKLAGGLRRGRETMKRNAARRRLCMWEWPWLQKSFSGATPLLIDDLKLIQMVKTLSTHDELMGLDMAVAARSVDVAIVARRERSTKTSTPLALNPNSAIEIARNAKW